MSDNLLAYSPNSGRPIVRQVDALLEKKWNFFVEKYEF